MIDVVRNPSAFLLKLARATGDIGEFKAGPVHIVCINAPDLIHEILVTKASSFQKMAAVRTLRIFTGDGLLVNEGATWARHRKLAAPAFHHQRIAKYHDLFVSLTHETVSRWRDGQVIDLTAEVAQLTLRLVARTLFSCDLDDIYAGMAHDIERALGFVNTLSARSAFPGGKLFIRGRHEALRAIDRINANVHRLIAARRQSEFDHGDLLSMLLKSGAENNPALTDEEVRDEAITMFVAGHETIAAVLVWTLVLLDQHPHTASTIRDEVSKVCGNGLPDLNDMSRLPFALQTFKEALRLYPPGFVVGREAKEDVAIGDFRIARGAWVMISPAVAHRNARIFQNPDSFSPERFSPQFEHSLPRGAYIPFGWGSRICIGNAFSMMEGHAILSTLVSQVSLKVIGPPPNVRPMITLNPDRRLQARVNVLK